MGHYTGTTISFSHRSGFWKSRYSFTPTCYAHVDNHFISTNTTFPESESNSGLNSNEFWMHGTNSVHNNFYKRQYDSKITVVSNQDPSAIKIFKTLSLESNSNEWTGTTGTNINPFGAPQQELQMGDLKGGFTTKEGNQYIELPKSRLNSDSNISYACRIASTMDLDQQFETIIYNDGSGPVQKAGWEVDIVSESNTTIQTGPQSLVLFRSSQLNDQFFYINLDVTGPGGMGGGRYPYTNYDEAIENGAICAYQLNNGTITLAGELFEQGINTENIISRWSVLDTEMYIVTPSAINGDPRRGHYMLLNLHNSSTTPVETYSINVDFENTKLDSSRTVKAKKKDKGETA